MNAEQFAEMMAVLRSIEASSKQAVEILQQIEGERLPDIAEAVDSGCRAIESAVIRN